MYSPGATIGSFINPKIGSLILQHFRFWQWGSLQSTLTLKEKVETNKVYFQLLLVVFLHARPTGKLLVHVQK